MGKCNKSLSADPYYILIYIITVSYLSSFESVTLIFFFFFSVLYTLEELQKASFFFLFYLSGSP